MDERIRVSPGLVLLVCGMIYLDTEGLVLPFLLSAFLHELGHLLAMACFGIHADRICLGLRGAAISARFPSVRSEFVSTLAGPMVNLLLLFSAHGRWPQLYWVNLVLLVYNLLPIYPLDGGRLLRLSAVGI